MSELVMFDLENRLFEFNKLVIGLLNKLPASAFNEIYSKQLVRSASSVGANYIEACEAESKKEFKYRIFISRKEAKESDYWLRLLIMLNPEFSKEFVACADEVTQLRKILSSIYTKAS